MTQPRTISVYIHWPFCLAKCPYCDFNSHVRDGVDATIWKKAFCRAIGHARSLIGARQVKSVFFGGGTPSLMDPCVTAAVIDQIARQFTLNEDAEITLEANPTSTETARFENLRHAGINRLSLGIQSLDDAALAFLGREHSAAEAIDALKTAQAVFRRTSFDLIYVRPGQTAESWSDELAAALKLARGHISLYQLSFEPGTPFYARMRQGRLRPLDDESAALLYERTQLQCEAAGLPAYEISNHAQPGCESVHNLNYWQYGEYLGIGPGAHSRLADPDGRYIAQKDFRLPEKWLRSVHQHGHGIESRQSLSRREQAEEWLMMGLRTNRGIDLRAFERRLGAITGYVDESALEDLFNEKLLKKSGPFLRSTRRSRPVLNAVLGALLAAEDRNSENLKAADR